MIDDYGEGIYRDLSFYHGIDLVDVVAGRGPLPKFVLSLVLSLPEGSLTAALMRGNRDHLGWTIDRHILADIFDAVNQNTRATGHWASKAPDIKPWPRPSIEEEKPKPRTVKELFAVFSNQAASHEGGRQEAR